MLKFYRPLIAFSTAVYLSLLAAVAYVAQPEPYQHHCVLSVISWRYWGVSAGRLTQDVRLEDGSTVTLSGLRYMEFGPFFYRQEADPLNDPSELGIWKLDKQRAAGRVERVDPIFPFLYGDLNLSGDASLFAESRPDAGLEAALQKSDIPFRVEYSCMGSDIFIYKQDHARFLAILTRDATYRRNQRKVLDMYEHDSILRTGLPELRKTLDISPVKQ